MFFKKKEAGSDGRLLAVQTGLVVPVSEVDDPVFAQSDSGRRRCNPPGRKRGFEPGLRTDHQRTGYRPCLWAPHG